MDFSKPIMDFIELLSGSSIRSLLGEAVYKRALDYYEKGAVLSIKKEPYGLSALVQGSDPVPYKVFLDADESGKSGHACTCPVGGKCKHFGAVLIDLMNRRDGDVREKLPDLAAVILENSEPIEIIELDTSEDSAANVQPQLKLVEPAALRTVRAAEKKAGTGTNTWVPFIAIESSNVSDPAARNVTMKQAAVRKDGQLGKVIKARFEDIGDELTAKMREIYDIIMMNQLKLIKLTRFLDLYGGELKDLPIYMPDAQKTEVFSSYRKMAVYYDAVIESIDFSPSRINSQSIHRVDFKAAVHVVLKTPAAAADEQAPQSAAADEQAPRSGAVDNRAPQVRRAAVTHRDTFIFRDGVCGWVLRQEDLIMIRQRAHDDLPLVKGLLSMQFIPSAVILQMEQNSSYYNLSYPIIYPEKTVSCQTQNPVPVFDVNEDWRGFMLEVSFRYGDLYFHYTDTDDPLLSVYRADLQKSVCGRRNREKEHVLCRIFEDMMKKDIKASYLERIQYDYSWYGVSEYNHKLVMKCSSAKFISVYAASLLDKGVEIRWKKDGSRWMKPSVKISWNMTSSGQDWLELQPFIEHDGMRERLFLEGSTMRLEKTGKWFLLDDKMLNKMKNLIGGAGAGAGTGAGALSGKNSGASVIRAADGSIQFVSSRMDILALLYDEIKTDDASSLSFLEKAAKLRSVDRIEDAPLPQKFSASLRPYQKHGYNWLVFLLENNLNGCLADDMGLGKTVQTICLMQHIFEQNPSAHMLIVQPVSTMGNWEREIRKFTQDISVLQHIGITRSTSKEHLTSFNVVLVSYATLRQDIESFKDIEWTAVILDESQAVKNPETAAFHAVKLLKASYRLCLTGTPVENSVMDLWSQMDFLNPGLLGSHTAFKQGFARQIGDMNDQEETERLRKRISPFILRRKKADVLHDLPEKEEIVEYIDMTKDQAVFYDKLKKECQKYVLDAMEESVTKYSFALLQSLTRMRQAAIWPGLGWPEHEKTGSGKLDFIHEKLTEIISEGNKVIVFSQFLGVLDWIEERIQKKGIKYSRLTGKTKNRDAQVDSFQNDEDVKLFLISLKAGGTGINLTAADYVIITDPWWNPAVEMQAVDRAHRIGRTGKVIVYRMITSHTIEEKVQELQKKKEALVKSLITEDESFFKSLSRTDIQELFE